LRVSMRASLNQLHERLGVTTVYVTHDQVEAMTLGDRVCVLRDGRLQQVDTPQTLFEAPVNLFVAGFIGSPAMNFVTAELVRDDGPAVTFAGYKLQVPAQVIEAKPGLTDYFGKKVILGIRPSDFEDATLGNASRGTIRVTAGVTEELGSEIMVIFTIDAPHVEHASLAQAAEVSQDEDEAATALAGGKSLWTARVSKESPVKHGGPLELAVDTRYLLLLGHDMRAGNRHQSTIHHHAAVHARVDVLGDVVARTPIAPVQPVDPPDIDPAEHMCRDRVRRSERIPRHAHSDHRLLVREPVDLT
ncbi:MAG TPA: hypothetical protein VJQ83_04835, partial [Tepidiformaceae bacterium]|nr:hypothetical protein [Tepidiformaceae bacterium]